MEGKTPPGAPVALEGIPAGQDRKRGRVDPAVPVGFASVFLVVVVATGFSLASIGSIPASAIDKIPEMEESTRVYDRHGVLLHEFFDKRRTVIALDEISPDFLHAILAVEDRNFYRHAGWDPRAIVRASLANLRAGRVRQGGSTLTQQLARMTLLTPERSLRRKIAELRIARGIERTFSKDKILELYANRVYFGSGFYGVEAAAQGYFGKPASALSLDEAALLAGLAKAPTIYSPHANPDAAVARRNVVLETMERAGFIDRRTREEAQSRPLDVHPHTEDVHRGSYAIDYVREILVQQFGAERTSNGGLRVWTTLDPRTQAAAERALEGQLAELEKRAELRALARGRRRGLPGEKPPTYLQGAVLAMSASTGEVYALVGGRCYAESQFNRAVHARRQPGSAFKPFVFSVALQSGMLPSNMIETGPWEIATPEGLYTPANAALERRGPVSLRTALRRSINGVAIALGQQFGSDAIIRAARSFGIEGSLPAVASLPLGSGEVTLVDMVRGYSAFPNEGRLVEPYVLARVTDSRGNVLREERPHTRVATDLQTAFFMTSMLADVVDRGTGSAVRAAGYSGPVGGKTGTTDDARDAWFIGFTPDVIAGVWVGFDAPRPILRTGYGGTIAVPIWASFMKEAFPRPSRRSFEVPAGITRVQVCPESNGLATAECAAYGAVPYVEYYPEWRLPAPCTVHRPGFLSVEFGTPTGVAAPLHR